jgi:hypothetical protein
MLDNLDGLCKQGIKGPGWPGRVPLRCLSVKAPACSTTVQQPRRSQTTAADVGQPHTLRIRPQPAKLPVVRIEGIVAGPPCRTQVTALPQWWEG